MTFFISITDDIMVPEILQRYVNEWRNCVNAFPFFHEDVHNHGSIWNAKIANQLLDAQLDRKDYHNLEAKFCKRLVFGTAGLRAAMDYGFNALNVITVLQTSQGVCQYMKKNFTSEHCSSCGVIIGYDARFNGRRLAHTAAAVFLSQRFKVYLYDKAFVATPLIAYGVVKKQCLCGIMITASHNPKEYNGYKLYASNGVQIIPPMDEQIATLIEQNAKTVWPDVPALLDETTGFLKIQAGPIEKPCGTGSLIDPYDTLTKEYVADVVDDLKPHMNVMKTSDFRMVYTAMHGVGFPFVESMLNAFGFDTANQLVPVTEQCTPDASFPTVSFPNPEEKGALNLGMATAEKNGLSVVIANDPDADRFDCAEKVNGKWHVFSGNEIGILFADYVLRRHPEYNTADQRRLLFTTTTVSSRMLQAFCKSTNTQYAETMTGFKWIMSKALEEAKKEAHGRRTLPVFAYEEAIGYAIGLTVRDKDGISAAAIWTEMSCALHKNSKTICDRLKELRDEYGYFVNNNSYYVCDDPLKVAAIFDDFRNHGKYKWQFGDYPISRIKDATTGFDGTNPGCLDVKDAISPSTNPAGSSEMITLFFKNGCVLSLRGSGTEPKLKWYAEMMASDIGVVKQELQRLVDAMIKDFLQPDKFPVLPPPKVS